jgi:hypothetical protein
VGSFLWKLGGNAHYYRFFLGAQNIGIGKRSKDLKDFTLTSRCISRHFWTALADR